MIMKNNKLKLWTSRYANRRISHSGMVPVCTSRGTPRFRIDYKIRHRVMELAPPREIWGKSIGPFEVAYRKYLEKTGILHIIDRLEEIARLENNNNLILLCFEDVKTSWCHRTMFAKWFTEQTGVEIVELPDGLRRPKLSQQFLFPELG